MISVPNLVIMLTPVLFSMLFWTPKKRKIDKHDYLGIVDTEAENIILPGNVTVKEVFESAGKISNGTTSNLL